MRFTTRVGLLCACIGLLAPRVFGDAIALEGKTFSAPSELFLIEVEHAQDGVETGGFTLELCSHCKVNGDSPFLFNPNLSQAPFSRDIFAPFTGTSSMTGATGDASLPTPIFSTSINGAGASTTTITIFDLPVGNNVGGSSANSQGNSNSQGSNSQGTGGGNATSTSRLTVSSGGSGGTSTTSTTLPRTVTTRADALATNPEPATLLLLGSGLVAGVMGRRAMRGRRV